VRRGALGEDLIHTRDYSDETARVIDEEVERILREQEDRCRDTLRQHRNGLDLVARALLERETIDGAEVTRLIAVAAGTAAPAAPEPEAAADAADAAPLGTGPAPPT
jgi:cell division protease FtsH